MNTRTATALIVGAFALGSFKGDDLVEQIFPEPKQQTIAEKLENQGTPASRQQIKMMAKNVFDSQGYDTATMDDIKGMTTEHGYILTGLSKGAFVAQCFIHANLEHVECHKAQ